MKTDAQRSRPCPLNVARVLVSADQIRRRVDDLARRIDRDYQGREPLLIVGILRGAFIFLADLTRQLSVAHAIDFMALSSYGRATSGGEVRILMDLREPIAGKHLLLVEDIIDSGHTLAYLHRILQTRHPASVRTCVMACKQRPRLEVSVDYLGFEIPDVWAVGYGLDHADRYRTLPYIAEFAEVAANRPGHPLPLRPDAAARRRPAARRTRRRRAGQPARAS